LTRDQASAQVTTLAIFRDGSQQDVTRREDWTTYRVSNPSLVNVTDHGAVNAIGNGSGQAFITATNEGATATIQVTVVADDPLTTVEGVAWTPEGSPVMGARVYVSSADGQRQIVTAADGRFSVDQVPTTLGAISVTVRATVDGLPVVGKSGALVVAPGGITDAGIITLRQGRLDNLIPIFDRSAATPALLAVAEDGTILNRYPVDFHAWAVAKNLSGDYWATDADELIQFSMDETEYIELGRYEFEGSDLSEIAIAPTGDLWICDNRRRTVSRFTPSGTFIEDVAVTYESTYGVAIAPHSEVAEGYYVWYTSYTNDSALAEVVRLNPSTGNRVRIPHTNARIWGLAVDHLGRIWVPLEVGGSPSRDRLVGYTADGTEFSSIVVNVTGTFMIDGVVTPDGHIWCAAADGHGSGFINPAYLFEFDENGSLLKEIDLGPDNLAPRGIFADGAGQVWTSLTAGRAMHVEPRNGEAAFRVTVEHPVNRGDPAGYLQAFIIHPDLDFDGDGAPNRQELQGGRNPFVSGE
jgi:streptogramin lyase